MPKVIESKIVITEELRGNVTNKLKEQERLLNSINSKSAAAGGGAAAGGAGGGRRTRADFETGWAAQEARMQEKQRLADEKWARTQKRDFTGTPPPVTGGGGDGGGGDGRDRRRDRGFGRYARGLGNFMGAGGAVLGATGGALVPAVGGALAHIGGAMTGIAGGLGGIAGLPLMGAGALMQMSYMAAQPALSHYSALAPAYRILGEVKAQQAKKTALGTWSPDEAIRISRQLNRVGAYEAFGTMTKMRFGGFEQEMMQPFFETAMKTGAAGKGTPGEFDRLARIVVSAFDKNKNIVSMEQSIETMTGLMGQSSNYLADISDDQAKELAKITHWGEASGTSLLRGQRMVETMGKITNWVAKPGEPGSEMFMWHALGAQGMNYLDFRKMRENPKAIMPVLGELAGLGDMGTLMLSKATGMSVTQAEKVLEAKRAGLGDQEVERRLKDADKTSIEFKAQETQANLYTQMKSLTDSAKLIASEKFMEPVMKLELSLTTLASKALPVLEGSINVLSNQMDKLVKAIEKNQGEPAEGHDVGTGFSGGSKISNLYSVIDDFVTYYKARSGLENGASRSKR